MNTFKPHISSYKFLKEVFGFVAGVVGAIKFLQDPSGWHSILALNWGVGCIVFWLVFGLVIPFWVLLAHVALPVMDWLNDWITSFGPEAPSNGDPVLRRIAAELTNKRQPAPPWIMALPAVIAMGLSTIINVIIPKAANMSEDAKVRLAAVVYGVVFAGAGVWYAFAHDPGPGSDSWFIRTLGWIGLIFLIVHGSLLLSRTIQRWQRRMNGL